MAMADTQQQQQQQQLHFAILPFMAQGHAIPTLDIAAVLADRSGVAVTLLLTPVNHARLKPNLDRLAARGARVRVEEFRFPAEEAGLPPGCENFDAVPSTSLVINFFAAAALLQPQVETVLQNMRPRANCLVADMCFPFAANVAAKLGIPRIFFSGMSCFTFLCAHHILTSNILYTVSDEFEPFDVPGMPGRISFTESQAKGMAEPKNPGWMEHNKNVVENEDAAFGVIINTFHDLERMYIGDYEKVRQKRVWCIGPVSMFGKDSADKVVRGRKSTVDVDQCLKWLDSCEPGSVIYACLGSISNLTAAQMLELGLGLEASGRPFIWVIRSSEGVNNEWKKSLRELMAKNGLEERVGENGSGLVMWGWAPQVLILSHPAVGGFLTHCGWNSSMERISAGVPMVTWPLFGDQFYNEKLLVDVLGIGVSVGARRTMVHGKEDEIGVQVRKDEVKKAVEELMGGDRGEGEARRKRARELAEKAKKAVEVGGSSHMDVGKFIEDVRKFTCNK